MVLKCLIDWKTYRTKACRCVLRFRLLAGGLRHTRLRPMLQIFPLALLAVLLLASCDSSGPPARAAGDSKEDLITTLVEQPSVIRHESLSAANLAGRAPEPLNLTAGVNDTCPVHHQKMRERMVPIVLDSEPKGRAHASARLREAFPFGAAEAVHEGGRFLPEDPQTARIFQCAACVAGRKEAAAREAQTVSSAGAEAPPQGRPTFRF